MSDCPYWKFYARDYLGGNIQGASMEIQGIFINLCAIAWANGGSIPDDATRWSMRLRITEDQYRFAVQVLEKSLECLVRTTEGNLTTKFMQQQRAEFQNTAEKNRKNVQKRWRNHKKAKQKDTTVLPSNTTVLPKNTTLIPNDTILDNHTAHAPTSPAPAEMNLEFGIKNPELESRIKEIVPTKKVDKFTPPTPEEVAAFAREIVYKKGETEFWNFYQGKGWMVGKNRMKDWRAAMRGWKARDQQQNFQGVNLQTTPEEFDKIANLQKKRGNF